LQSREAEIFDMTGFCRRAASIGLWVAAGIMLSAAAAGHAAPIVPKEPEYDANVNEDGAAKACVLALLLQGAPSGEAVTSQLIVARIKQNDTFTGPRIVGFRIEAADKLAKGQASGARPIKISSAAFVSEAYTAVARPRIAPFEDGSLVISTLDFAEGGKLVDAVTKGKFQVTFTRRQPAMERTYNVTSAPPEAVLARFGECLAAFELPG
jgi:hypothetical protein